MVRLSALVAIAFAIIAAPATAQQSHINIRSVEDPRLCLTEGGWHQYFGGDVFVSWCQGRYGNYAQRWQSWEGGWTRNVSSGHCLEGGYPLTSASIRTWWCAAPGSAGFPEQVWRHWQGGWKQRQPYRHRNGTLVPAACLSRWPGEPWLIISSACVNPNTGDHPRKLWTWEFVPGT